MSQDTHKCVCERRAFNLCNYWCSQHLKLSFQNDKTSLARLLSVNYLLSCEAFGNASGCLKFWSQEGQKSNVAVVVKEIVAEKIRK